MAEPRILAPRAGNLPPALPLGESFNCSSTTLPSSPETPSTIPSPSSKAMVTAETIEEALNRLIQDDQLLTSKDVDFANLKTKTIRHILQRCYVVLQHHGNIIKKCENTPRHVTISQILTLLGTHTFDKIKGETRTLNYWILCLTESICRPTLRNYTKRIQFLEESRKVIDFLTSYKNCGQLTSSQDFSDNSQSISTIEQVGDFYEQCKWAYNIYLNLYSKIISVPNKNKYKILQHYLETAPSPKTKPEDLLIPELFPCVWPNISASLLNSFDNHEYKAVVKGLFDVPNASPTMEYYKNELLPKLINLCLSCIEMLRKNGLSADDVISLNRQLPKDDDRPVDWNQMSVTLTKIAEYCKRYPYKSKLNKI